MNLPRLIILIVALTAGLGAAYVSFVLIGSDRTPVAAGGPPIQQTEVLVVVRSVPAGTALGVPDLRWIEWPERAVTPGMILRSAEPGGLNAMVGKVVLQAIFPGEPLRRDRVLDTGGAGVLSAILPPGRRAYAVSIDEKLSAGGFVLPNDRVDILAVGDMTPRGPGTRTILQNVRVLAIGHRLDPSGDKVALARLATLEVSPAEVELLSSFERTTTLLLSLRGTTDSALTALEYPQPPAIIVTGR